jgi:uncharacterized protein (TIGR02246 family)
MQDDERAIRELVGTWLRASAAGDYDQVLRLMADDVVFLVAGQPPMRGKAAFAKAQEALKLSRIEASGEIQEVRVFGDWAYCWNELSVTLHPPGGPPVKRAGNVLSILQRQQDGRWLIVRDANMLASVTELRTESFGRDIDPIMR